MFTSHIVDLEMQLQKNRMEAGLDKDKVVARVAKEQRKKDIAQMMDDGYSPMEISVIAHIPLAVVENHVREIEIYREGLARFHRTGDVFESQGGYVAVLPK